MLARRGLSSITFLIRVCACLAGFTINGSDAYAVNRAPAAARAEIEEALTQHTLPERLAMLENRDMSIAPDEVPTIMDLIWKKYVQQITNSPQRQTEMQTKAITYDGMTMRYDYQVVGEKPARGYPLYIALHGGGGASARVNDSQWEHMKVYYLGGVTNGIYLAPRGVNNEWNLHWRAQSFACHDRIIENMIAFGQVDPNRVYLMGFSAGGDAIYQIPARMPDRWTAAAMSAGHPNGVPPDNYANLGFLIQVGARDAAYKRNQVAAEYGVKLNALQAAHPGLYHHATYIHAGRGHNFLDHGPTGSTQCVYTDPKAWLEQGPDAPSSDVDAHSIRWLDQCVRNPYPHKLIWDVKTRAERSGAKEAGFWPTAEKANLHYWIGIDRYDKDTELQAERIVIQYDAEKKTIHVQEIGNFVRFYLHPAMFTLGEEVIVRVQGRTLTATPRSSLRTIVQSILDRGDPHYIFPATLTLSRNPEGNWMLE